LKKVQHVILNESDQAHLTSHNITGNTGLGSCQHTKIRNYIINLFLEWSTWCILQETKELDNQITYNNNNHYFDNTNHSTRLRETIYILSNHLTRFNIG